MSYVLEALKRAEAERGRGSVPDLHAQPALPPTDAGPRSSQPSRLPWPALAGGLAVVVAALAWWITRSPSAPPVVASAPVGTATPVVPTAPARSGEGNAPWTSATPSATATARVVTEPENPGPLRIVPKPAAPPPPAPSTTAVAPPPVAPATPPARSAGTATARPGTAAAVQAPSPAVPAPTAGASPVPSSTLPSAAPNVPGSTAANTPAATTRIPALAELPPALRSELPAFSVSGSMHSPQASQRLVILNGQVLHEGDRLSGTDVTVETIRPKSAVLRYKQQRFELAF